MGCGMSWRVVAACAAGTSHTQNRESCQDSCIAKVVKRSNQPPLLSIFVSDGAGSVAFGGRGAELAVEAAVSFVASHYAQHELVLNHRFAGNCIMAVRERLYGHAEENGLKARDYACTMLGVLSGGPGTLVMQIGDGAIVLDAGNGLEVPVPPMSGEYANMTRFVTDEDAIDILATQVFSARAKKVAVFSDGIQRLALNMATNTPHEPFFDPLFKALSGATPQQEQQLKAALVDFLNSAAINDRTDDDKTLALAILSE
jgi:hypothetical protein